MEMTMYKDPPPPKQYLMDQVSCNSTETSLWDCSYIGGNDIQCNDRFVAVKCSGNVKLSLNLNGQKDKCAGVVEFSTGNDTFGVCNSHWDNNTANMTCQELGCGDHHYIPNPRIFKGQPSEQTVLLDCIGDEKYSWQCMDLSNCPEQASVICKKHSRFRLRDGDNVCSGLVEKHNFTDNSWVPLQKKDVSSEVICQQLYCGTTKNVPPEVNCTQFNCSTTGNPLQQQNVTPEVNCTQLNCGATGNFTNNHETNNLRLTCSDNVKLRNFKSKCFGEVVFDVNNNSTYGVCFSESYRDLSQNLSRNLGKVVCRELGCGEVLDVKQTQYPMMSNAGMLSNVECWGDEVSLWHCLANRENKQCPTTTVTCAGSLDVRLSDGLGRCSGRVELKWEGSWWSISSKGWTTWNSDVICEHLGCGKSTKVDKKYFIEGKQKQLKSWNVDCKSSSAKLHECLKQTSRFTDPAYPNVQIICQKEELMFFEGDSPCKGKILIKSFDKAEAKPLPKGQKKENEKKASDTCHAMGCGNLINSTYDNNVTCSGSVSVVLQNNLKEKCWGTVEVCRGENCGRVCKDTWENQESEKICNNLGCGDPIKGQLISSTQNNPPVLYYSVYCFVERQNMSMCKFITMNDSKCNGPAQVICTGSIKARLKDPRDKCAGDVLLFYSGDWKPVCEESLDENLKNTICKELNCGESYSTNVPLRDKSQSKGLSGRITCESNHNSVSECNLKGILGEKTCTVGYLKCTGWERLLLYKNKSPCSGPVYALSGGKIQSVNVQGWSPEAGQQLCNYLQCGNYKSNFTISTDTEEWWNKTYNCLWKTDMWECKRKDPAVQPTQINITCDGDFPNIMLSNGCTGKVLINNESVCASHFNDVMSDDLCDSLDCGRAIHHWGTTVPVPTNCYHFSCTGKETLLWQCGFKKSECKNVLSVACRNSIKIGSTKKCGGKLAVNYRNQWEYVCGKLNKDDTKMVCRELNCTNVEKLVDESKIAKEMVTINCAGKPLSISQCVKRLKEVKKEPCTPAEIQCEGYIEEVKTGVNSGLIVGLSLAVLGLIMVFMWMNRKRLLLALRHYRNKNRKDINSDRNEMNNMEKEDRDLTQGNASLLEYDDYEDVDSDKNKIGDEDADDRIQGSSGTEYDDIEGQNSDISPHQTHIDDDLPLLPKRPNNILDEDTYEVETENQEEYDDVMPVEAAANENEGMADTQAHVDVAVDAGTDSEAGTGVNADAVVVTAEVEVHAEPE
ncbi:scavenger receptor cysteine-rich type 1 protein M160 isoform X2 [Ctenopharyngodon idella]|uniref:scavenger receptor cysteine-rich type 1 protein M160 isoform X2 n=1 Tax=Ctenopharyngodon idella TaxID=7959 RepID=UPI00223083CD|nr:scavenger receptor cysteine-rich type 1 protein M160 isoform X2 [Ctenopharyngodon idella]